MRISTLRRFISIQDPPPRGSRRVDESGLTTLEWLLIVAAVAGLAALAVVLVQNVVDDTAEKISNSSARGTAAKVAAAKISQEAFDRGKAVVGVGANTAAKEASVKEQLGALNTEFKPKCDHLKITYSNVPGIEFNWRDGTTNTVNHWTDRRQTNSPLRYPECVVTLPTTN